MADPDKTAIMNLDEPTASADKSQTNKSETNKGQAIHKSAVTTLMTANKSAVTPPMTAESVGEIFLAAGSAFAQLGQLTTSLKDQDNGASRWTSAELSFFRSSICRFSADINQLTNHMRKKTEMQLKMVAKRKAYEEAGVSPSKTAKFASETVKEQLTLPPLQHCQKAGTLLNVDSSEVGKTEDENLGSLDIEDGEVFD